MDKGKELGGCANCGQNQFDYAEKFRYHAWLEGDRLVVGSPYDRLVDYVVCDNCGHELNMLKIKFK